MQIDDMYEDEMIKLASEMSLMEDFDLEWDAYNLEDGREKIKQMEELVDESLLSADHFHEPPNSRVDSTPISKAQILDIFALSNSSTNNTSAKTPGKSTTPTGASYNLTGYRDSADSLDRYSQFSQGVETPVHLSRRPSALRKDGNSKDTVLSIRWKLRWYQKKIVDQIERTHEAHNYSDGRLAVLIELNDYVTMVLSKVDMVTTDPADETPHATHETRSPTDNERLRMGLSSAAGGAGGGTGGGGLSGSGGRGLLGSSSAANNAGRKLGDGSAFTVLPPQAVASASAAAAPTNFPSVVSAVYALRRGGNRQETLSAVDNLIQLCNFGGELCLPAVKQMMAAGALQSLLSTLSRAAEWPEVEKQISKVVSILVTYEDDWALLQRSALFILSALYTLQVKTLTQFKTSTKMCAQHYDDCDCALNEANRSRTASCASTTGNSLNNSVISTGNSVGVGGVYSSALNATIAAPSRESSAPFSPPQLRKTSSDGVYETNNTSTNTINSSVHGLDTEVEQLLRQQEQRDKAEYLRKVQEEAEEEQESLKALLSAAVAKLSLVLASEWGKLSTPLGGAFGSSGTTGIGSGLAGMSGMGGMGGMGGMSGGGLTAAALGGGGFGGGKGLTSNSSRIDPQRRPLSIGRSPSLGLGIHSNNTDSSISGGRGARNVPKTPAVENDRILQILLNLIETLADDSLNPTRTQLNTVGAASAGSLGIAAITRFLVKSGSAKTTGLCSATAANSNTSTASTNTVSTTANAATTNTTNTNTSTNTGLPTEPGWLPPLQVPEVVTRQNSASDGAGSGGACKGCGDDEEILKQGAIFFSPLMRVDSAAVMCSAALCNLAEVPQCRPGLVSSGALKMIKSWLEIGNDVLAQARVLCFNQLNSPRSHSSTYNSSANAANNTTTTSTAGTAHTHTNTTTNPATTNNTTTNTNTNTTANPLDEQSQHDIRESCRAFMEAFGPAYELISNAAAALMHLSGGTDGRFSAGTTSNAARGSGHGAHTNTTHMQSGAGGREYIIGWIDAQILAEGLPAVVVKMLHTGVEAFTSLEHTTTTSTSNTSSAEQRATRSVLPAAVGMHLAQTLYQLCSRVQNRQQLQSIDIPFALCILFENIASQTKLIYPDDESVCSDDASHYSNTKSARSTLERPSTNSDRKSLNTDSIYAYIFHFGGIYSSRNTKSSYNKGSGSNTATPVSGSNVHNTPLKRDTSSDFLTLYSANVDNKFLHRKNQSKNAAGGNRAHATSHGNMHNTSSHSNTHHHHATHTTHHNTHTSHTNAHNTHSTHTTHPNNHSTTHNNNNTHTTHTRRPSTTAFMKLVPDDLLPIMSSITSSCLDALTYFFADEICKLPYNTNSVKKTSAIYNEYTYKQYYYSIVELMCSERVIESIKMTSSFLPRGAGRLATIRVISALTEWPQSLVALYEGGIMDVLMLISSEADEIQQQRLAATKTEPAENTSFFNIFPTKPSAAERNISGASSISAISSSNSTHKGTYRYNDEAYDDYYEGNDTTTYNELSLEETLSVCYALSNLCEANTTYALRMLQSGLFSIMLKLVRSKHMEISRQALRSISSMCSAIALDPVEKQKYYKTKGNSKNSEFNEALVILSECLRSPSALLQKGATYTISLLALIDVSLQDAIVEGPLRTIISLLVDPKNDREVRSSAEEVLKNLGFLSGVLDFELCGYDVEILRDWYTMKRSQGPQDAALALLREWVANLFNDDGGSRSMYQLHRQPGDSITSANEIVHELCKILNCTVHTRMHRIHSGSRDSFDATSELNNFLNTTGLAATATTNPTPARLAPLSIPTLHRNFTESIMRFLPFCIKSPFHDSTHNTPSRSDAEFDRYDTSPAAGSQYMNRSMHPSTSLSNLASPSNANHVTQSDLYEWLDRPPVGILHLMELFYSSKLHQLLLMDMTSLGVALTNTAQHSSHHGGSNHGGSSHGNNYSSSYGNSYNSSSMYMNNGSMHGNSTHDDAEYDCEIVACDFDTVYILPHPHSISAIMLPQRAYQSFSRVGRVIEKMIEYDNTNKMWSLIFRDSEYLGDFHTSLLSSLRRCPQICSLSFSSTQRVEEDALLGHLVGQIPPSIRFVSFKSTLSRESIQALCMLLRRHNAAFLNDSDVPKSKRRTAGTTTLSSDSKVDTPTKSKGLLGLALTHLTFDTPEINYIIELLQQRVSRMSGRHSSFRETSGGSNASNGSNGNSNKSDVPRTSIHGSSGNGGGRTRSVSDTPNYNAGATNTPHSTTSNPALNTNTNTNTNPYTSSISINTPTTPTTPARHTSPYIPSSFLGGLRFLDLSYNALNDTTCARILSAALNGPLEGLELGGNIINRGLKFSECMELFTYEKMSTHKHRLRYLGLSHNNLMTRTVATILEHLTTNNSLTSLDLSENDIDHTSAANEMLRRFIKCNTGLRNLDLCHNKLNADSYKEIHLGLLENDSLLLLPMAGNSQVEVSPTVNLIQIRLRENRLLYKSQTKIEDFSYLEGKMEAFQTEEEIGQRISISNSDVYDTDYYAKQRAKEDNVDSGLIADREEVPIVTAEVHSAELHSATTDTTPTADTTPTSDVGTSTGTDNAKVPGYTLAIAVPVEAYTHTSAGAYNYNNGRARTFSSATGAPLERKNTIPGTSTSTTDLPKLLSSPPHPARSRPNSISLSASMAALQAAENVKGEPAHAHSAHPHTHTTHASHSTHSTHTTHTTHDHHGTYALPPSSTHPLLEAAEKFSNNTLNVFFSAPLAGFDRNSRPHPLEMLDYTSERELLTQVFREVHRDVSVHFDFATTDALRTALSFGCKALHFSGHGIPHGLCFEDGRAGLQVVKDTQLRDLLGAGGLNLQFVFVSACYSMQVGEAFVKAGVPHVVCVKVDTKIQDAAAIAFTRAFYVALLSGKSVKSSFLIAKEALKSSPYVPDSLLEGAKFILLPDYANESADSTSGSGSGGINTGADDGSGISHHHNKAIFPSRPVVDWPVPGKHCTMGANLIDVKTFISSNHLPSPPADFEGREVVMHNVIRSILDRRLVSLVGEDGMGKTSVAAAICKYVSDRELFADGIVYFKAKGHKDYRSFLSGLQHALLSSGSNSIAARIQALLSTQSNNTSSVNLVYPEEEIIFSSLESMRMLLVLDTLEEIVSDYGDSHTDFRLFLGRLFEQCPYVKVLVVSTDTLSMHNINVGFGIVEYSVLLGPLTLISTLRLFARLAPSLSTATAKREFISALQPHRQLHVSIHSRDINRTAIQILQLFGDGHPAKIVQIACESTKETVEHLRATGMEIISTTSQMIHSSGASVGGHSVGGHSISMASYSSTPTTNNIGTPQISASTSFNVL